SWSSLSEKLTAIPRDKSNEIQKFVDALDPESLARLHQREAIINAAQRYNAGKGGIPRDIEEIVHYAARMLVVGALLEAAILFDDNREFVATAMIAALGGAESGTVHLGIRAKAYTNPLAILFKSNSEEHKRFKAQTAPIVIQPLPGLPAEEQG